MIVLIPIQRNVDLQKFLQNENERKAKFRLGPITLIQVMGPVLLLVQPVRSPRPNKQKGQRKQKGLKKNCCRKQ